jgi:hypothetical protein
VKEGKINAFLVEKESAKGAKDKEKQKGLLDSLKAKLNEFKGLAF